jgi:hypothetical protein
MLQADKAERDARIVARRNDGISFAAIGSEFNLTFGTVRIVVKQMKLKAWWCGIDRGAQLNRVASLNRRRLVYAGKRRPPRFR